MDVLLWILATASLIGGIYLGVEEEEILWFASGLVSFAVLGGFASVIGNLKEISSKLTDVKGELTQLRAEESRRQTQNSPEAADGADAGTAEKQVPAENQIIKETHSAVNQEMPKVPHIFYCRNCGAAFGGTAENKPEKCSKCSSPITETSIVRDVWRNLSGEQRIQALFDVGAMTKEEFEAKKALLQEQQAAG